MGDAKSGDMREPASRFVYFNSFQMGRNFVPICAPDLGGTRGSGG